MKGSLALNLETDTPPVAPAAGDPAWAVPYVPEVGRDWREWHEPTMRGMMADLGARHPGWTAHWWTDLECPSPAGADDRTWTAVCDRPVAGDVRACVHFSSWDHRDDNGNKTKGAPVRIAAYPGGWRDGRQFTLGCAWQSYTDWCAPRALERVWRLAVGWLFPAHGRLLGLAYPDLMPKSDEALRWLRADHGWTTRTAMLAAMLAAPGERLCVDAEPWPNQFVRRLTSRAGAAWDDAMAAKDAETRCWAQATDDLPWPDLVPRLREVVEQPLALSLFDAAGVGDAVHAR